MSFGVGDLFGILAGGAFVAREAGIEICERAEGEARSKLIKEFVVEHTDAELEQKLTADVENPSMYNDVWKRLEEFKRDNPLFCKKHTSQYDRFGWENVGKERLPFRDAKGTLIGKSQNEELILKSNRNIAVYLLMQTYGIMTANSALEAAREKYPLKPTKRHL